MNPEALVQLIETRTKGMAETDLPGPYWVITPTGTLLEDRFLDTYMTLSQRIYAITGVQRVDLGYSNNALEVRQIEIPTGTMD
jgi:hypothetical protein